MPWLDNYAPDYPASILPVHDDAVSLFRDTVARAPDSTAVRYFDGQITFRELDAFSDALALALGEAGVKRGDRVALYLQNVPQYLLGLLAIWKSGAIAVSVNPMNRGRELTHLLVDSGATVLVCLEQLYREIAAGVIGQTDVRAVFTTSELDFQTRDDPRFFADSARSVPEGTASLTAALDRFAGEAPPEIALSGDDVAVLTYTSGTTGPPKGAMNTHRNLAFASEVYRVWCDLSEADTILGFAPLFHVTGLVAHLGACIGSGASLVLMYRFDPAVVLETIRAERPTFTAGAITAFLALMDASGARREDLASLTKILSGGAPIPAATMQSFGEKFGQVIHNVYGLTETTSPAIGVPLGAIAPIDAKTGACSVGLPVFDTDVRVLDDRGEELPAGEIGELAIAGPQVVPGYWEKPEETENALGGGWLRTGDVGYMDAAGWFYVVDRKKDQINAGGYKVWPREVEDVISEHPAVREAAVVGVPDGYRGETVKAFVTLRPGASLEEPELIAFCKERMAAYKYPRAVEFRDELPKTASGKTLRRELRRQD